MSSQRTRLSNRSATCLPRLRNRLAGSDRLKMTLQLTPSRRGLNLTSCARGLDAKESVEPTTTTAANTPNAAKTASRRSPSSSTTPEARSRQPSGQPHPNGLGCSGPSPRSAHSLTSRGG
jgi:hypothetical protein